MGSLKKGIQILQEMLGRAQAARIRKTWRRLSPDFERYVLTFLAGEIWARKGLDRRTRSLCTISALAALGRSRGLELNIQMALRNGATRTEVLETLLHIAPYAGFPAAWEGIELASRVFAASTGGPARRVSGSAARRDR